MRLSDKSLTRSVEKDIQNTLLQIIADIRTPKEAQFFFDNILTETERLAIAKRLAIATMLTKGHSYEEIKKNLKVSSATVAKIQESLDQPGMKLAINKIQTDQWVNKWAAKITSSINKVIGQ